MAIQQSIVSKKKEITMSSNPKKTKKRAASEKSEENGGDAAAMANAQALVEEYLGPTLLQDPKSSPKSTIEALKGKDMVGLYFGASWSGASKVFSKTLTEFYEKVIKADGGMEIIYVSSDNDVSSFHEYFSTMPWYAMDGDMEGTRMKHNLATHLKAFRIPGFYILNLKTGQFITDRARKEIEDLFEAGDDSNKSGAMNVAKGKELLASWREREPENIGHGSGGFNSLNDSLYNTLNFFAKYPMLAITMVCICIFTPLIRRIKDNPLLGLAIFYVFTRLGRENGDRNVPYIEQMPGKGTESTNSDKKDK